MINRIKAYIQKVKCDYYGYKANSYRGKAVVLGARYRSAVGDADEYMGKYEIAYQQLKEITGSK